jgi:DNA-binding CsgD family transcriptional regulator
MDATVREITDFTVHVLDSMVRPEFPAEAVLGFLRPALDAPTAVFQRTQRESGDTINIADGVTSDGVAAIIERSKAQWRMNALMEAAARGDLAPNTIQRAIGGQRLWRSSPDREFIMDVSGCDQMASVVLHGGPDEVAGVAFGRSGDDFTTEQLELLSAVQPLLQAIERHARAMQRWSQALGLPLPELECSVHDSELSARQVEVLVLLAEGLTAGAMARRLGCSPRTVHKHVENLYRKLGVQDRVSAILEAQRRGLLPRR